MFAVSCSRWGVSGVVSVLFGEVLRWLALSPREKKFLGFLWIPWLPPTVHDMRVRSIGGQKKPGVARLLVWDLSVHFRCSKRGYQWMQTNDVLFYSRQYYYGRLGFRKCFIKHYTILEYVFELPLRKNALSAFKLGFCCEGQKNGRRVRYALLWFWLSAVGERRDEEQCHVGMIGTAAVGLPLYAAAT